MEVGSLDVLAGDRIELLGSNASGKSTLARVIAGCSPPSSGSVDRSGLGGRPIGFLPQSGGLYPDLTVFQNIVTIARLFGRRGEVNDYTEAAVVSLGLGRFLHSPVASLSGGVRRLAGIASILCARPAAIILDEPFASLDTEKADRVRKLLRDETDAFQFVIVLGHQPDEALAFQRVIRISNGAVEAFAPAAPT